MVREGLPRSAQLTGERLAYIYDADEVTEWVKKNWKNK
jgi:hypothetical protein